MKVKEIMFFSNGNIAAFDNNGEQIPEIQKCGWLRMMIAKLRELGVENLEEISFLMPNGSKARWDEKLDSWRIL